MTEIPTPSLPAKFQFERIGRATALRSFARYMSLAKNSVKFLRGVGLGCSVLARCRFRKSAQFLQGVGLGLYRKEVGLGSAVPMRGLFGVT
jgi:hypothetical protein